MRYITALATFALLGTALAGCESENNQPACGYTDADGNQVYLYADDYGGVDEAKQACEDGATGAVEVIEDNEDENGNTVYFDTSLDIADLYAFGGLYDHSLGISLDIMKSNPATSDSCYVGYNAGGGTDDWDPEHCVMYVDEVLTIDGDGDGVADNSYAVVQFDESTEPYIGNVINAGEEDCWDPSSEYYKNDSCWASIWMAGGEPFTAWVGTDGNVGDYEISVFSHDDGLEEGPDNGI